MSEKYSDNYTEPRCWTCGDNGWVLCGLGESLSGTKECPDCRGRSRGTGEKRKLITTNCKTREQMSNPHGHIPHAQLLEMAGVKPFKDPVTIDLDNDRMTVVESEIAEIAKFIAGRLSGAEAITAIRLIREYSAAQTARVEELEKAINQVLKHIATHQVYDKNSEAVLRRALAKETK